MHVRTAWAGLVTLTTLALGAATVTAPGAAAVDTQMTIDRTAIDFGAVAVGTTAPQPVTLTNGGSDPFGPVNMFGGAPPTAEYGASQSCQGQTLAAGASCTITYTFTPSAPGPATDVSRFTISETASQSDGEDFTVTLAGTGGGATTTTTPATTTTTRPATTTTGPPATASPSGGGSGPATGAETTTAPTTGLLVTLATPEVTVGGEERAMVRGFAPNELVSAVMQPGDVDLGARVADADGVVRFAWTIADDHEPGTYEFVANGAQSGSTTATFTVARDDGGSGDGPLIIAAIAGVALLVIALAGYAMSRRSRSGGGPDTTAPLPPI